MPPLSGLSQLDLDINNPELNVHPAEGGQQDKAKAIHVSLVGHDVLRRRANLRRHIDKWPRLCICGAVDSEAKVTELGEALRQSLARCRDDENV
eukprot:2999226-Amphidinium_carterae.1